MPLNQNKRIARSLANDAQNRGRVGIHELLSEDLVDHTRHERLRGNRDDVRVLFAALCEAFPDLNVDRSVQTADDDQAVTCKVISTPGAAKLPASGSGLDDTSTIRNWRNCRERAVLDKLRLLRQLDAIHA